MTASEFTNGIFGIAGKTAVVTGGTSGIGSMIAEGLVRAGARVIVASRKPDVCEDTANRLGVFGECTGIAADVSKPEGAETLARAVDDVFEGGLDILVNNAGATWGLRLRNFPTPHGKNWSTSIWPGCSG